MALLAALCLFRLTPDGTTSRRLRPHIAALLGAPDTVYAARQMGYDLRRPAHKGLIAVDAATERLLQEARLVA